MAGSIEFTPPYQDGWQDNEEGATPITADILNNNYDAFLLLLNTWIGNIEEELVAVPDFQISSPSSGQVLKYNGSKWVNANESGGGGGSSVSWQQILQTGTKIASITIDGISYDVYAPTPITNFSGLSDVALSNPSNGQVIQYNSSTSKWENKSISTGDSVGFTQILSSGTKIGIITINGTSYDIYAPSGGGGGGSSVSWNQVQLSGFKIAEITIDGASQNVYIPNIPANTSDLNNDSNFVADASYVHTDNNYTTTEKNKLADLNLVEANPSSGTSAGNLNSIEIGGTKYDIPSGGGGGTTVVANPTGTPTGELLAIQIGNDIYSLPEGESEHLLNDILTGPDTTKATASSTSQDGAIWKAFDGVKTGTEQSCWIPEYGSTNCWICYHFATPKYITKCHVYFYENMSGTYTGAVKIQGSNDGGTWTDISQSQALSMTRGVHDYEIESTDIVNGYSYVRMFSETALVVYGSASACTLELEIYGRDNASGTTVIPNPEGEATDTLTKIQIGNDIYSLPQGGSGGGSSIPAYSTNETSYCAWIDGTTVYQKTFTIDGDGTTREFTVQTGITNGKRLINAQVAGLRWDNSSKWWAPCYINIDNFSWSTHFSLNSDFSEFVVKAAQFPLKNITVTLYYTKTDDIPYHGGGGGGHTILNDSGTSLAQEDDLQFKGTYSHDDSTNGKTVVEITREMTQAEYDLLSADEKKGIIRITDDNYVCDGTEVKYSTGVSVKDKIDEVATDSGWITLSSTYNVKYRKIGKQVQVTMNTLTELGNIELGTLPEGYRPSETLGVQNAFATGRQMFTVRSAGTVALTNSTGTYAVYVTITYFVN